MPHFHNGPLTWPDNRQGQKRGTASWKWYFSLVTRSLKNKAVQLNRLALIQMTSFRRDTHRSHSPQSINAELLQLTTYMNLPLNTCEIFAAKSPYAGLRRSCSLLLVISSSSESSRWGIYLCKSTLTHGGFAEIAEFNWFEIQIPSAVACYAFFNHI